MMRNSRVTATDSSETANGQQAALSVVVPDASR
jgi:hypothetical protein